MLIYRGKRLVKPADEAGRLNNMRISKTSGSEEFRIKKLLLHTADYLFLGITGVYLLWQYSQCTTFALPYPWHFSRALIACMIAATILRIGLNMRMFLNMRLCFLAALVYCLVYYNDRYSFLLYTAVLVVGLAGIDYRKIIGTYLLFVGVFFLITIMAGITGTITNYVFVRAAKGIRSSWGICYPTDLSSSFLFLLMMLWVFCKKLPDPAMLVVCIFSLLLSWFITYSSTGVICGTLFLLLVLYHMLEQNLNRKNEGLRWVGKCVDDLLTVAFLICGCAFFALVFLYRKGFNVVFRLDHVLSSRLKLAVDVWEKYGIKPFGTPFEQIGAGFSAIAPSNYNFVDSTYPLIVLRYGFVLFALICFLWVSCTRKAICCGDRRLAFVMGLIAVHAFSEHHFMEAHYNILLVMPFAAYTSEEPVAAYTEDTERERRVKPAAALATAVIAGIIAYGTFPTVFSLLKTFYEIRGLTGGGKNGIAVIAVNLLLLLLMAAMAVSLHRLILLLFLKQKGLWKATGTVVLCCGVLAVFMGYLNSDIDSETEIRASSLQSENTALELIMEAAEEKVYAGCIPAIYKRIFKEFSYSVISGEELARYQGTTVILDNEKDYQGFFKSGFLYTPISAEHAVYTADASVAQKLSEAGYHLTSYYSTGKRVNLRYAAKINKLPYSKKNALHLQGPAKSLVSGPYFDLFGGRYKVDFTLDVSSNDHRGEGKLCSLFVVAGNGEKILLEKEVTGNDFNEKGEAEISIYFAVNDTQGAGFWVSAEPGKSVYVRDITYRRSPEYDTHAFFDKKMRLIWEEYYDTEGTLIAHSGGYYSMEQEYDAVGNLSERSFFDENGNLTITTDGYAKVKWYYNAKRQIIREEFLGTLGEAVKISDGQAANEREYDEKGNVIVYRYYDVDNNPVITDKGYAELHRRYDDNKKIIYEEYIGPDGTPLIQQWGYSAMEQEYGPEGKYLSRRYLHDGMPVLRTDGYAEVRWDYNGLHQQVFERFFDTDGNLIKIHGGYAADEREYDAAGNMTVIRYFDEHAEPVEVSGYAELHREYDNRKQIIKESYYGAEGTPIMLADGYASWERDYINEGTGRIQAQRHFDDSGKPVCISAGYYEFRREYDNHGNMTMERYYAPDGTLIPCSAGYASLLRAYDSNENLTEEWYLDTKGDPVLHSGGYAKIQYEYNDNRELLLTSYLDLDGNPIQAGSRYFHEFLQTLLGKDVTVFISVKDEATNALTAPIIQDLKNLGIKTDLRGHTHCSFYAVVSGSQVLEEIDSRKALTHEGSIANIPYKITSAGFLVGNNSSVIIGGTEYSKNQRGMNIVVFDNVSMQVTDSVTFDTWVQEMTVTR